MRKIVKKIIYILCNKQKPIFNFILVLRNNKISQELYVAENIYLKYDGIKSDLLENSSKSVHV